MINYYQTMHFKANYLSLFITIVLNYNNFNHYYLELWFNDEQAQLH